MGSYLWFFGEGLLGPMFAIFTERIGGDIFDITGAYAGFLFANGILTVFIGRISDHGSKVVLMVLGYFLNAVMTFGYLLVDTPGKLLVVQIFLGASAAMATPTWDALFSQYEDKRERGKEWGWSDGGPMIVSGVALLFGGYIVTKLGFDTLFILMGLVQIVALIIQTRISVLIRGKRPRNRFLKTSR